MYKLIKIKSIISLLLLSYPLITLCQQKQAISSEIQELLDKENINSHDELLLAKKIMSLSVNDLEKTQAHLKLGFAYMKFQEYALSINHLKSADSLAILTNNFEDRFAAQFVLSMEYRDIGLKNEADKSLDLALEFSKKVNQPYTNFMVNQAFALKFEKNRNYKAAIPYRKLISTYLDNAYEDDKSKSNKIRLASSYNTLAFDLFKDNQLNKATYYLNQSSTLNDNINEDEHYLIELYYMNLGIFYVLKNNYKNGRFWFDKAMSLAKHRKNKLFIDKITEERLFYNIDDKLNQKYTLKNYINFNNNKQRELEKISEQNIQKKQNKITETSNYLQFSIIILVTFIICFIVFVYFFERRKIVIKSRFEEVISTLEKEINNREKINFRSTKNTLLIPKNKEIELVKKLEEFEQTDLFISKNFSLSSLTSILETNTKYTSALLQNHRNKNFNEYINSLKINYIVKKIYTNPEYVNYKIDYLAEHSGFSSHSRFTQIFKKEMNMSPSEFINNMIKKNKS